MKKVFNKDNIHVGYIAESISIHRYIHDEENWYLTINKFNIFGKLLCKKTCTEQEIARYVNVVLHKELIVLNDLIKYITPFTSPQNN